MITLASENHGSYDTFGFGDIVQVTGSSAQLAPDNGYWNISWEQWQQGSTLTRPGTRARGVACPSAVQALGMMFLTIASPDMAGWNGRRAAECGCGWLASAPTSSPWSPNDRGVPVTAAAPAKRVAAKVIWPALR